jgi:hypothetical protein
LPRTAGVVLEPGPAAAAFSERSPSVPDDPVANYQDALHRLREVTDQAASYRQAILHIAGVLQEHEWMETPHPQPDIPGDWPTAAQLVGLPNQWRNAFEEVKSAFKQIPKDRQVGLKSPDEILPEEQARYKASSVQRPAV